MDDMQLLIDLYRRQSRQGPGSDEASARALVAAEREEMALYTRFRRYYSYGFYVAERVA